MTIDYYMHNPYFFLFYCSANLKVYSFRCSQGSESREHLLKV